MNKDGLHRPELRRPHRALLAISLAALTQLGGRDVRGEAARPDALRAGLARVCITPERPLWLHGYAGKTRFRPFEGKLNDLFAKALALEDARGEQAVLIAVDLCVLRAAEVCRVAAGSLEPIRGPLQIKFHEVDLPLKPAPPPAELRKTSGAMAHNARRMLAALERGQPLPSYHKHPLALWQFGEDLTFVGLSGEVVSGYVPLLTRALGAGRLWIAGYCSEVDGYLPDATIVAEGGYEARGLVADIGFYSADAEQTLVKAVRDLQQ